MKSDPELQKAVAAIGNGEFDKSFAIVTRLATQGMAMAQHFLGWHYHKGIGVDQDDSRLWNGGRKRPSRGLPNRSRVWDGPMRMAAVLVKTWFRPTGGMPGQLPRGTKRRVSGLSETRPATECGAMQVIEGDNSTVECYSGFVTRYPLPEDATRHIYAGTNIAHCLVVVHKVHDIPVSIAKPAKEKLSQP